MIVDALVFRAGLAPQNKLARGYRDWAGVVTDAGAGPVALWSVVKMDRERWLLPGTRCRIDLDPDKAGGHTCFAIDYTTVPTVTERIAAADPTVVDPIGSRRAAKTAYSAAREVKPMFSTLMGPGEAFHKPQTGPDLDDRWYPRYEQATATAATYPAPPGMVRAIAIVTAMRLLLRDTARDLLGTGAPRPSDRVDLNGPYLHSSSGNETLLAIHAPPRAPWATFVSNFKSPDDKPLYRMLPAYPFLPVLAPETGTGPVTVLWDEIPAPSQVPMDARTLAAANPVALIAQVKAARRAAVAQSHQAYQHQPADGMPPAAHAAAARFVAYLRSLPPQSHPAAIHQAIASLNPYPPPERDRYLALWRRYGIPV